MGSKLKGGSTGPDLLGGSWVVTSAVISLVRWLLSIINPIHNPTYNYQCTSNYLWGFLSPPSEPQKPRLRIQPPFSEEADLHYGVARIKLGTRDHVSNLDAIFKLPEWEPPNGIKREAPSLNLEPKPYPARKP